MVPDFREHPFKPRRHDRFFIKGVSQVSRIIEQLHPNRVGECARWGDLSLSQGALEEDLRSQERVTLDASGRVPKRKNSFYLRLIQHPQQIINGHLAGTGVLLRR
jgi:hypothetical protein